MKKQQKSDNKNKKQQQQNKTKKRTRLMTVQAGQNIKPYIVSGVVELIGSKRLEVSHVSSFRQVTIGSSRYPDMFESKMLYLFLYLD